MHTSFEVGLWAGLIGLGTRYAQTINLLTLYTMLHVILSQKGFEATATLDAKSPKEAAELTAHFVARQINLQKRLKTIGMGINSGVRTSKPLNLSISLGNGKDIRFSISISQMKTAFIDADNFALGCGWIAENIQKDMETFFAKKSEVEVEG